MSTLVDTFLAVRVGIELLQTSNNDLSLLKALTKIKL